MGSTPAELVKEKLDIAEFLKGYLTLQQAGKNFKANCPFHKEKTPSFMVSPERQSWHCFGCGLGGDAFSFLMRYENIEFGEALRILAEKTGVELRRLNPAEHKFSGMLFDLNERAKEFYKAQLAKAPIPQKYLTERGLTPATIKEFEIGWAPPEAETLTFYLLSQNFRPEDLIQAGLMIKTERGSQIDRFRGRIMFPIHNHMGKVVGFTGRILPQLDQGTSGKYVNSPETAIFNKSKLLYGFWKTKNAIRDQGSVFMVEGQMDMLMSWQAGIQNAVATSGTALTADHLRTLRRFADKLVLSFDNDSAGLAAGERAIDLAEAGDFQVKVASLGDYKDPGEMGEKDPNGLLAAVASAHPAAEFYFDRYLKGQKFDLRDRAFLTNLRAVIAKLKHMASPIERNFWLSELAKKVRLEERVLHEEMERVDAAHPDIRAERFDEEARMPEKNFSRWELLSQRLLAHGIASSSWEFLGPAEEYLAPGYGELLDLFRSGARKSEDPATDALMNVIVLRAEELSAAELPEVQNQLKKEYLKERRRELIDLVKRTEEAGDDEANKAALSELDKLPKSA